MRFLVLSPATPLCPTSLHSRFIATNMHAWTAVSKVVAVQVCLLHRSDDSSASAQWLACLAFLCCWRAVQVFKAVIRQKR